MNMHRRVTIHARLMALAVLFVAMGWFLGFCTSKRSHNLLIPSTHLRAWDGGKLHAYSFRTSTMRAFGMFRNNGEPGLPHFDFHERKDSVLPELVGFETRLFGFPFPFAGTSFALDYSGRVVAFPKDAPVPRDIVQVGRVSFSLWHALICYVSWHAAMFVLLLVVRRYLYSRSNARVMTR